MTKTNQDFILFKDEEFEDNGFNLDSEDDDLKDDNYEDTGISDDSNEEQTGDNISFEELMGDADSTKTITPEEVEEEILKEVLASPSNEIATSIDDLRDKLDSPITEIFPDSNGLIELLVNLEFKIKLRRFYDFEEIKGFTTLRSIIDLTKTLV